MKTLLIILLLATSAQAQLLVPDCCTQAIDLQKKVNGLTVQLADSSKKLDRFWAAIEGYRRTNAVIDRVHKQVVDSLVSVPIKQRDKFTQAYIYADGLAKKGCFLCSRQKRIVRIVEKLSDALKPD